MYMYIGRGFDRRRRGGGRKDASDTAVRRPDIPAAAVVECALALSHVRAPCYLSPVYTASLPLYRA